MSVSGWGKIAGKRDVWEIDAERDQGPEWTVQPVEKDINCHVHKSMPLDPILSRKNPMDLHFVDRASCIDCW